MTTDEDDNLAGYALEVAGGYFYARGERDFLRRNILESSSLAAQAIGTFEVDGYSVYRSSARMWTPWAAWSPAGAAGAVGRDLADYLNRAIADPDYANEARGAIEPWCSRESLLSYSPEVALGMNVREWSVSGQIGGFSFDLTIPTGTRRRYLPTLQTNGYTGMPLSRSAFGWTLRYQESGGGASGGLRIQFGLQVADGSRTAGFQTTYNADPARLIPVPVLTFTAGSDLDGESGFTVGSSSAYNPASYSAPAANSAALFCGVPLWTMDLLDGGTPTPADFDFQITPHSFWTTSHKWRGEPD